MTDTVLFLPSQPGGDALLLRRENVVERGPVEALNTVGPLVAVLPGQDVRAFATELPGKLKPSDRLAAARFAQEDQLSSDPAELHIVLGPDSPATTAVVAPAVMEAAIALSPARVISDFDALAGLGEEPVALLDRVVYPGPTGYAVDADWSELRPAPMLDEDLRDAVFKRLDSGLTLDLRTGPYRRRSQLSLGRWSAVAATALVCAGLGLGLALSDALAVQAQAEMIRTEARALYENRTGQPAPASLSQLPSGPADDARFLTLSQALFAATANHPEIEVERLSWEARDGVLRLRLVYPDFDAATALEASFAAQSGAQFTTGGVREQNGRFIGDAALASEGES